MYNDFIPEFDPEAEAIVEQPRVFQVAGIQPIGTVVYKDRIDGYTEQVLMSNSEARKQLIHCYGPAFTEGFRIEYIDNLNRESNLFMSFGTQADAEAVYIGL